MKIKMDATNILLSVVMVVSAFVLTFQWLEKTQYARGDAIIVLSAMVLIAALASLMLSVEQRLRKIEERIESTERGLRINIQSVEENMDRKLSIAEKAIRRAEYH